MRNLFIVLITVSNLVACGGGGEQDGFSTSLSVSGANAIAQVTNDVVERQNLTQGSETVNSSTDSITLSSIENSSIDVSLAKFVDVSQKSGIQFGVGFMEPMSNAEIPDILPSGVASGDFDLDGDIDLMIVRGDIGPNLFYRNLGSLIFEEIATEMGIAYTKSETENWRHSSPALVDLDGDRFPDLVLPGLDGDPTKIFKNINGERFLDVTEASGLSQMKARNTMSPAFADVDLDGDLDMAFGHWGTPRSPSQPSSETEHLWRNDTDSEGIKFSAMTFSANISPGILLIDNPKITQTALDYTFTPTFADINNDHYPDLLMVADFYYSQIFINNRDGTFLNVTDLGVIKDGNGMGSAVGDFDGDGDIDWFVSSIDASGPRVPEFLSEIGNRLYRNDEGFFSDASEYSQISSGGWGWGSCALDLENDGDLDIYQTNGWHKHDEFGNFSSDSSKAFVNRGDGIFDEMSQEIGLHDVEEGRGIVCSDLDRDGDVDILQLHKNETDAFTLWENRSSGNFLTVSLEGRFPNTQAVGAKISLKIGSKLMIREVRIGNNFASHNPAEAYFGLGDTQNVEELIIRWPDGTKTKLSSVTANQHLIVRQDEEFTKRMVVNGGSGTGQYQVGEEVVIEAMQHKDNNYEFSHWNIDLNGSVIRSPFSRVNIMIGDNDAPIIAQAHFLPKGASDNSQSVARRWNEIILQAIRNDFARPTVHARNLFHVSAAMYDAWSIYNDEASPWLLGTSRAGENCPLIQSSDNDENSVVEAVSFSAYRLILHRFTNSPGYAETKHNADSLMDALGLDTSLVGLENPDTSAPEMGNYIADCYRRFGLSDGANETGNYANVYYKPVNLSFNPEIPGNGDVTDLDRWQPLRLTTFIDQSGKPIDNEPEFFGAEWGGVYPFALPTQSGSIYRRDGVSFKVYHDPGPPPKLADVPSAFFKWGHAIVAAWSAHLDYKDGVTLDISPNAIGNTPDYPSSFEEYIEYYDMPHGPELGQGYTFNDATSEPYKPQIVPRGDFTRVLAEFWADGPDSETPPGHWYVILNSVSDNPHLEKRFEGVGEEVPALDWDIKSYFALGGAMHDAAIAAWGSKGWYDTSRPISVIRGLSGLGQSTDPALPSYNKEGMPLRDGHIELVTQSDVLVGDNNEHLGKIKIKAWRGPSELEEPTTDSAGVGWILAENWWSYQRPTFVTPPFAGYVSGHSTYSRAAAEILTAITGDPFFPGGMSEFRIEKNEFLVFEEGPSVDMTLQWATYRDAADQCGLSRIWGGIHPPTDDIPGRMIGKRVGVDAFSEARKYFEGAGAN